MGCEEAILKSRLTIRHAAFPETAYVLGSEHGNIKLTRPKMGSVAHRGVSCSYFQLNVPFEG
jgi:hypothetical protein